MMNLFRNDDLGKLVLRLTLGVLMLMHGIAKMMNPAGSMKYIGGKLADLGMPEVLAYGVYVGEVVAPVLIILGLFSRIGGLLVVGNMLFAIVLVHSHQLGLLGKTGGWALELQGFYLFCGLAVLFLGSGKMAIKPD